MLATASPSPLMSLKSLPNVPAAMDATTCRTPRLMERNAFMHERLPDLLAAHEKGCGA